MSLDLQKVTIRRLLETQNHDLYSKLVAPYFSGANSIVYSKIQNFYKANMRIPSLEEFLILKKDVSTQEYIETEVYSEDNKNNEIANEFLVSQLQDFYIREETIGFLDKFIDDLDDLEKVEIVDKFQNHLLNLNKAIPISDELYDVAELDLFPSDDDFIIYPSGLSAEYDSVNGGFASQELVLIGGRRGSGKSIISVNMAINRFLQGNTVAFFTIEMRYKEVYDRILSITSGVPFLNIFRNRLSEMEKLSIAKSKIDTFYKPNENLNKQYELLLKEKNFTTFEHYLKLEKPELKDNRLFIIDDESLTLNRIDHYCNMFENKYPKFNMAIVDYINIIKHDDSKDWKTQIILAEALKAVSRKYDLTVLSPYQIDATGEARYSKGILDSADRSFNFFPAEQGENREQSNKITIHTTKMRNGKHMSFDVYMDWECVKIDPNISEISSEKPHKAVLYGTDEKDKDL